MKNKLNILFILILLLLSVNINAFKMGDVNNDNEINMVDALMTAQYNSGMNPAGFMKETADVNGDYIINNDDVNMIANYYTGTISEFPNLVINGKFTGEGYNWYQFENFPGDGFEEYINEELRVNIINNGENIYDIGISYNPIKLEAGYKYILTFDAIAASNMEVQTLIHFHQTPWFQYDNENFTITTEKQTFSTTFTMTYTTDIQAALEFHFGGNNSEWIIFDNVTLLKVNEEPEWDYYYSDFFLDYEEGSDGYDNWLTHNYNWKTGNNNFNYNGEVDEVYLWYQDDFAIHNKDAFWRNMEITGMFSIYETKLPNYKPAGCDVKKAVAGIVLYKDRENYWVFSLNEDVDGSHYSELRAYYNGVNGRWGDKYIGESRLTKYTETDIFNWEFNKSYILKLELKDEKIIGTVENLSGEILSTIEYIFEYPGETYGKAGFIGSYADINYNKFKINAKNEIIPVNNEQNYVDNGNNLITGNSTGYFHTENKNGIWWLMTPEGNSFFTMGPDIVIYNAHYSDALDTSVYRDACEAQFGSEEAWGYDIVNKLSSWGFNSLGIINDGAKYKGLPHSVKLRMGESFVPKESIVPRIGWIGFPDVFSPGFIDHCDKWAKQFVLPQRDNKWIVGYYIDNELEWHMWNKPGLYKAAFEHIHDGTDNISYAKLALVNLLRSYYNNDIHEYNIAWNTAFSNFDELLLINNPPETVTESAKDFEKEFVKLAADKYFSITTAAIRKYDPNHLILGCRFAKAPYTEYNIINDVVEVAGNYCDALSFNFYPHLDFENERVKDGFEKILDNWYRISKKPIIITEWSYIIEADNSLGAWIAPQQVKTQEDRAKGFKILQDFLFSKPYMIGSNYFMLVDQPEEGGFGQHTKETFKFGLVTETNEPYEELTTQAAITQGEVYERHDVNLLKNGDFENGELNWGDFTNGYGEVSMSVIDGEAVFNIANWGTNPWDVGINQSGFKIDAGYVYKLQFDIAVNEDTPIRTMIQINGEPYTEYAQAEMIIPASEELQTYTCYFVSNVNDSNTLFSFHFGGVNAQANTIKIDNVILFKHDEIIKNNILKNGQFYNGKDYWYCYAANSQSYSYDIVGNYIKVDFNNADPNNYTVELVQHDIDIEPNSKYTLTFDAKATEFITIIPSLQRLASPWDNYDEKNIIIAPGWKTYTCEFITEEISPQSNLKILLGGISTGAICLDNIVLSKNNDILTNGDFNNDTNNWSIFENNDSISTIEQNNGNLLVNVNNINNTGDITTKTFSIALRQDGFPIESGYSYKLSFDAKSTSELMKIYSRLQMFHEPWESYFTKDKMTIITNEWGTYDYIVYIEDTDPNVSLVFFLGDFEQEGKIWFDNIKVEKIEDLQVSNYTDPKYIYEYSQTKFVPADGKTLLIIGQEINSIVGYNDSFDYPAGYTSYMGPELPVGETITFDDSNYQNPKWVHDTYGDSVMHISLWLRGPEAYDNSDDREMCQETIDGLYDDQIDALCNWAKTANIPIYLRIGYEFDGNHNYMEPEEYKAAYKYIVDKIRSSGADNFAFIWHSVTNTAWSDIDFELYYPGDSYVDWFGVSFFNEQLNDKIDLDDFIDLAKEYQKPVMICESAPIMHGTTDSGIKADSLKTWYEWFVPIFNYMNKKNIKGFSYINCNWDVTEWAQQFPYLLGNTQVQDFPLINEKWIEEINKEKYIKNGTELFNDINFIQ